MNKYIQNANYYLAEAKNQENDLLERKESCDLAYKNFGKAQKETDCTAKINEVKNVYKDLAEKFYCKAVEMMDEVCFDKSACPNKIGDTSLEDLDRAITYFKNAKQCGTNNECETLIKQCQQKKKQLSAKQDMTF